MNKTDKIWRLIPILLVGLYLNYKFVRDADEEFIFKNLFLGGIFFILLLILIGTNIKDIKEYKQTRSKLSFIPTLTGLILISSLIVFNYKLQSRDDSPLLMQAGYDGGFNGAWFEFREDGTYKFANSGGLGASYSRGTYIINDSIITIDTTNIDNVIQSNLLIIRNVFQWDSTTKKILYQINNKHEIIDKEFSFTINEDNRQ